MQKCQDLSYFPKNNLQKFRLVKKFYLNNSHPSKGLKGKLSPQYGIAGQFVFCYNKKGTELIFPSINGAKQHFKVRWTFIKKNIDTQKWVILQMMNE